MGVDRGRGCGGHLTSALRPPTSDLDFAPLFGPSDFRAFGALPTKGLRPAPWLEDPSCALANPHTWQRVALPTDADVPELDALPSPPRVLTGACPRAEYRQRKAARSIGVDGPVSARGSLEDATGKSYLFGWMRLFGNSH